MCVWGVLLKWQGVLGRWRGALEVTGLLRWWGVLLM